MFLISPFDASGGLCIEIVALPGYLHLPFCLLHHLVSFYWQRVIQASYAVLQELLLSIFFHDMKFMDFHPGIMQTGSLKLHTLYNHNYLYCVENFFTYIVIVGLTCTRAQKRNGLPGASGAEMLVS